mgnify:CR=1 FL=1
MKILVTGSSGFVGKNLTAALENIKNGKDRTRSGLHIEEVFYCDVGTPCDEFEKYCKDADFVFNLAGVNRPEKAEEFLEGNFGFAEKLLKTLGKHSNFCPVMLSSSVHAAGDGDYGKSKKAGEDLFFEYSKKMGAPVFVYRFPNVFGKWCRPNYNSVIATFCHNIANGLEIKINDPKTELELLYIDDLVREMLDLLEGRGHKAENGFMFCPVTHRETLGYIADLLRKFSEHQIVEPYPDGSFEKKLFSAFVSYLPPEKAAFSLKMNKDSRGSFTEIIKTDGCGQFSVNVSGPGITKGEHWHNSKWEIFVVVSGKGVIRQRRLGDGKVFEYPVSGDEMTAVRLLPGYTHNIENLSDSEPLVTFMWANENFDPSRPDTYSEKVEEKPDET